MSVHRIKKYGAPVLRDKAEQVTAFDAKLEKLLRDLEDTLRKCGGLGLAAPQIGVRRRVFVAFDEGKKRLFKIINPQVLEASGEEIEIEGCLSFPDIFFSIKRPLRVVISCETQKGRRTQIEATGLLARCFVHEIDHLNGKLIIDYATAQEKKCWKEKLDKLAG
jgi:peptide deformylase